MTGNRQLSRPVSRALVVIVCWAGLRTWAAAATPVVNAGADDTVSSLDLTIMLLGEITDNGNLLDSSKWTQLSGAGSATIFSPVTPVSKIRFPDTSGVFVFELRAYYGTTSYADTVVFTVKKSLRFLVLKPVANELVPVGKPYVIRWQIDPERQCQVDLSVNGGRTYAFLGGPTPLGADSLVWTVDPTLSAGTACAIRVKEYQNNGNNTTVSFNLAPGDAVLPADRAARQGAFAVTIDNSGTVRVSGLGGHGWMRAAVYDLGGAVVMSAEPGQGVIGSLGPRAAREVLVYRVIDDGGTLRAGVLTSMHGN